MYGSGAGFDHVKQKIVTADERPSSERWIFNGLLKNLMSNRTHHSFE
jgi:hypothetical protein